MKIVVVVQPHGEADASLMAETIAQLRDKDTKLIFLHSCKPFNEQLLDEFVEWIANGCKAQALRITDGFDLLNELWYIDTYSPITEITFMGFEAETTLLTNVAMARLGLPNARIEIVQDCIVGEHADEVAKILDLTK